MSHDAGEWDASYQRETPAPWDLGRPQPIFADLVTRGLVTGDMLDAGCGTGEHSLLAAAHGARTLGVDLSTVAIDRARRKAAERGLSARFEAGDILTVDLPAAGFDTVVDSGLFHSFDDEGRARYVDVLRRVTRVAGFVYVACFSDLQPGEWGPRRVSRNELVDAFADGWAIEALEPAVFELNPGLEVDRAQAWLLVVRRTG